MRFTDKELDSFDIDPARAGLWGTCPFCGGTIVIAHRRTNGNRALYHSMVHDAMTPALVLPGCERYIEVASVNAHEFMRLLQSAGFHAQWLQP